LHADEKENREKEKKIGNAFGNAEKKT